MFVFDVYAKYDFIPNPKSVLTQLPRLCQTSFYCYRKLNIDCIRGDPDSESQNDINEYIINIILIEQNENHISPNAAKPDFSCLAFLHYKTATLMQTFTYSRSAVRIRLISRPSSSCLSTLPVI